MKLTNLTLCLLLCPITLPVYGEEGFKTDNTPDCSKPISKGAQNALTEYANKQYQFYLDKNAADAKKRLSEDKYNILHSPPFDKLKKSEDEYFAKYPQLSKVDKLLLKRDIQVKTANLISFALVKHKCDLTGLKYPELPTEYRF